MNRNNAYKMSGLKMTNTTKARAQRLDEQNGNRRMARQAKNDAKRGLAEIDQNVLNVNTINESKADLATVNAETTHKKDLQNRLARLKVWREQRAQSDEKAKAKKKVPFLVPGVARASKPAVIETKFEAISKPTGRVTRSQAKKPVDVEKQWTVTTTETVKTKKLAAKSSKKEDESFAPKGFLFTAPKEITVKAIEFQEPSAISGTPLRQAMSGSGNEEMKISPLVFNHPWISTTRGSSSKKQRLSLEAQVNQEPQSSPLLKRRSIRERKSVVELSNPDALHFRALMASEGSRLTNLCNSWEELLSDGEVPEEETGSVRTVIGQAHLLQRERFTQFAGLVTQFENKSGEKEITPTDLEGFWEMIYLQVSDVDRKFDDLTKLKDNGWVSIVPEPQKKSKAAIKKKAPVVQARAAKSNMRALIAAARKKQLAENGSGSPVAKRRSSLLMSPCRSSPLRTPGKRQSLRRSVLLNSAKKPVFIVTDIVPSEQNEMVDDSNAGCPTSESDNNVRTPKRVSRRLDTGLKATPVVLDNNEESEMDASPSQKKTYGRTHVMESVSPEERLSEAFDALKTNSESLDRMTPLKVFRSPLDTKRSKAQIRSLCAQAKEEIEEQGAAFSPRRSVRLRGSNVTVEQPKEGRVSLLPTTSISPVIPNENLISFD